MFWQTLRKSQIQHHGCSLNITAQFTSWRNQSCLLSVPDAEAATGFTRILLGRADLALAVRGSLSCEALPVSVPLFARNLQGLQAATASWEVLRGV